MNGDTASPAPDRPRYRWPWFVLAAFILAVLLAILWMSHEIRRTQRIKEINAPTHS